MSRNVDVDRLVASWIDEQLAAREPVDLLERVLDTTSRRRPRARWLGRLYGHHLASTTSSPGLARLRKERPMVRSPWLIAGAAAVAIAVVVGFSMFAPRAAPGIGSPLSASPSAATPTRSPATVVSPGPLRPGVYVATKFQPGIRFEVGTDWSVDAEESSFFALRGPSPSGVFCPEGGPNWGDSCAIHEQLIVVELDRALGSDEGDCEGIAAADSPTSADGMAMTLAADPRFVATAPEPVTVGGLHGQVLELKLADRWTGTCTWSDGKRAALVLTAAHPPGGLLGLIDRERTRLYLLSSPDGVMSIAVDPAFRTEAGSVIGTFEFGR